MAQSRTEITNAINTSLPTTGNEDISALDLRGVLISNILSNFFSLEEDSELPTYTFAKTYKTGKIVLNQGLIWRAILDVPVSQPPPTLPIQSNTYWIATAVNIPYSFLSGTPNLSLKADLIGGLVPASQLPSYVDDILVFANLASFPVAGESGKIYLAEDSNIIYRWSGVSYVSISQLDESTQIDVEDENTNTSNTFVSPRRLWQAFNKFLATAWSWAEKQIFSKGVALGNNTTPANGDLWFNNGYFGKQGGVNTPLLTSLNGKYGRVLFVSKEGNDSTGVIGSQSFPFFTVQAAVNACPSNVRHTIVVFEGTYLESVNLTDKVIDIVGIGNVKIENFFATYNNFNTTKVTNTEFLDTVYIIELFGNSRNFIFEKCKFPSVSNNLASFRSNGSYKFIDCELVDFKAYNPWGASYNFIDCKIQNFLIIGSLLASNIVIDWCTVNNCIIDETGYSPPQKNKVQFENCKFITTASQNMQLVNSPTVKTLNCLSNKPFNPAITNNHNPYLDIDLI